MRRFLIAVAAACLLAGLLALPGCGSDDSSTAGSDGGKVEDRPAPPKSEFPAADGRTLGQVLESASPAEVVVSPAAVSFETGRNRYPFGVFEKDGLPVNDAEVALYFAKVPEVDKVVDNPEAKGADARALEKALDQKAVGPFPARVESMETEPAFRAQTTSQDPNAATTVYVTDVDFPSKGEWRIAAMIKEGDELKATLLSSAVVGNAPGIPRVGDKAPVIHTPTADDAGGDLSQITTRIPPDTQNKVDFADVVGKEPVVLLFATPQFCQSRVCGPVVDVAEQVKETYGDEAAFIHMEIYEDNEPPKTRPQVRAYNLPSEPWLFVIDKEGTISTAIEGAFGVEELTRAVQKVTGNGQES